MSRGEGDALVAGRITAGVSCAAFAAGQAPLRSLRLRDGLTRLLGMGHGALAVG